jgi:8-oxo-dGTP pyrophosphatase MutT (NUDIX family)
VKEKCSQGGCDRPIKAHELCQMHYDRHRSRHGRRREDRVLPTRARNRATAALIKAHADEFKTLYDEALASVTAEDARVRALAEEMGVDVSNDGAVFRLKRGPVAEDEDVEDRALLTDEPSCRFCATAHDRGHSCPECGTTVGMPVERATSTKDVREHADALAKARAAEVDSTLAEYDEFEIGDRYRVRVPPSPDDYDWDEEMA